MGKTSMSRLPKSIFCATMHKAGSSIADRILTDICQAKGLKADRISLQLPQSPLTEPELFIAYQDSMVGEGIYYGVARGPYVKDMPVIYDLKTIIQVRDPRDCLTSAYFSFRESHVEPTDPEKRKAFLERRRKLQDLDIDQYARSQAGSYKTRMRVLKNIAESHDDVLVLTYEDMVTQTESWLGRIAEFVGQPITQDLRMALDTKINFAPPKEDTAQHKRQVSPGDHLRKLTPGTIATITEQLAPELAFFGYSR